MKTMVAALYTTKQSPLAKVKNGQRIRKVKTRPGDVHQIGATGTVIGSIHNDQNIVCYFIYWDEHPDVPIAMVDSPADMIEAIDDA